MTGLYRRGETYWLRYSQAGAQLRESLGTKDEAEAVLAARAILANPVKSTAKIWESEVKAYVVARLKAKRLSANAAVSRKAVLLAFGTENGITAPQNVTAAIAGLWYRSLQERIAETTAQTYVRWLRTFFDHLISENKLRRNPVEVKMDQLRKTKRKAFCTQEQMRLLIDSCQDDELKFVLYCGFHCGCRREEIIEARPEWFDLTNGIMHLQRSDTWEPKDKDDRSIPMSKEFVEFLKVYGLRKPFMIEPAKTKKGKWRYRYDFRRPFELHAAACGLPWVTPHTMRRTFASLKVSAGVSLYKVAIWLGDLERVVQESYGFLIPKDSDIERGL